MQCPLKGDPKDLLSMPNELERLFSKRLESVRKDVECTFGVLKNRFRILKVPLLCCGKHGQDKVDNIFYTCCMLHNMLLEHDGLIDWETDWSHVPGLDEVLISETNPNLSWNVTDWNNPEGEHQNCSLTEVAYSQHHNSGPTLLEEGFFGLRNKLIEHFNNPIAQQGMRWNTLINKMV